MSPTLPPSPVGAFLFLLLVAALTETTRGADWPHWHGPQRDSVWRETGVVATFPPGGPPVRWRTPLAAGYSSPVVSGGRVFVLDRPRSQTRGNTGGALKRMAEPGIERVVCLDQQTGQILWTHEYDCPYDLSYPSGPRAAPEVDGDRVYTLGAEGHLHCLEAATGRVLWSRHYPRDFAARTPLWGFASAPVVEGDLLLCLTGGEAHTLHALDKRTGEVRWRALPPREPAYSTPVVVAAGGTRQLLAWDAEAISGLRPATGEVLWSLPFKTKLAHAIGSPRLAGDLLLLSTFFDGSKLLRLAADRPAAAEVWSIRGPSETRTEGLHSLMGTPFIADGHIYGVCAFGQLRCLRLETGERVWETLAPTTANGKPARHVTAFLVRHEDRFFLYNELGQLLILRLTPAGWEELGRTQLVKPTNRAGVREVHWSHPAFAGRAVFVRNDEEIACFDLAAR